MSADTAPPRRPSPVASRSTPPTKRQPSPPNQSLLNTLSYPVSYTVSGLLRRISADEAPTPLARALSANYNGSMPDLSNGMQQAAPKRRLSPFQPPPLTPLSLFGHRETTSHRSKLLSRALAEEIRLLVPPRLQLVDTWRLVYSLEQDGTSLASLYGLCDEYIGKRGGFVLAVKDGSGGIFGAYLSDAPHPSASYYGTGECFLWRTLQPGSTPASALPSPTTTNTGAAPGASLRQPQVMSAEEADLLSFLPPPPSADTTHLGRSTTITSTSSRTPSPMTDSNTMTATTARTTASSHTPHSPAQLRFKAFPYTGDNDFTILCGASYISVGGGQGRYGLWLDAALAKGVSETCPTFANEPLASTAGSHAEGGGGRGFEVLGVEVWYIGS